MKEKDNSKTQHEAILNAFETLATKRESSLFVRENREVEKTIKPKPKLGWNGARWRFLDMAGNVREITEKQKLFADNFIKYNGDRQKALIKSGYKKSARKSMIDRAYLLLQRDNVNAYINTRLSSEGFNDENVAKQHLWLINQHHNVSAKVRALDLYYRLKGLYYSPSPEDMQALGAFSLADLARKMDNLQRQRQLPDEAIRAIVVEKDDNRNRNNGDD